MSADELQSRYTLLGVCTACPGLQTELAEKNARIASLEKASSVSMHSVHLVMVHALLLTPAIMTRLRMKRKISNFCLA
jgi:hypothetical protein